MNFLGSLSFKGAKILRWIKREENNSVELLFDVGGDETTLEFSRECWDDVVKAVTRFLSNNEEFQRERENTERGNGKITPHSVLINLWDESVTFAGEGDDLDLDENLPGLEIKSKKDGSAIYLNLNTKQAKELHYRLSKMIEAQGAFKEVLKKKLIQPKAQLRA